MQRKRKSYSLFFPLPFLSRLKRFLRKASHFAGHYGGLLSFSVVILWAVLWFSLSEIPHKIAQGTKEKILEISADAGFSVENILVEGRVHTDPDILLALINITRGDPLFSFVPDEAQKIIEKISWVKSVHVERRLPDTIYVNIEEREPLALWQRDEKLALIDKEGVILTEHDLSPFKNRIILTGEDAPEHAADLLNMLFSEPVVFKNVESAARVGQRRWNLYLCTGAVAKLPEKDIAVALRRLSIAQEEEGLLERDVKMIDVREDDRIIVRTSPGAVREYRAGYNKTNGEI